MYKTIILALLCVAGLFAQEKENDTLAEVVLESKRDIENTLNVPSTTITAEKIAHYAPTELTQVLNETTGVHVFSGGLNTNRLTVRGMGSRTLYGTNKIQGYYNGIPITSGIGETAFNMYDPESFENLTIVKGPKATQYGANLGGALLMKSKKPTSNSTTINEHFTVGSFGMLKNSLHFGYSKNDFYLNVLQDHLQTDGYRENSNYKRNSLLLDMGFSLNQNNKFQILVQQLNYNAQIASSINKTDFDEDSTRAATNWMEAQGYEDNKLTTAGITYTHSFSDALKNKTTLFYSYLDHYEPRPFNILDEFSNSYGFRSVFSGEWNALAVKNKFNIGAELYTDTYQWSTFENLYEQNNGNGSLKGDRLSDNKEYRNRFNAFFTWEFFFNNWTVTPGLHYNTSSYAFRDYFNTGDANKNAQRDFDAVWAPSLTVNYNMNQQWNAFGNISYGYNLPNLEETLTPEGVINPDIGPETGWNYEVGSEHRFFNRKLKASVVFYYMDIDNLLVADRVGEDQYIGRNAGETSHKGMEIALNYNSSIFNRFLFQPYVNFTFNHHKFENYISADEDYSGNKLTGVPKNMINGGFALRHEKGFFFSTTFQHVGSMPMNDANSLSSDAFSVLNFKIGYQTKLFKRVDAKLIGGINNVLDEKYASSILINAVGFGGAEPRYYYPGLPINYYGGVTLKYHL